MLKVVNSLITETNNNEEAIILPSSNKKLYILIINNQKLQVNYEELKTKIPELKNCYKDNLDDILNNKY